MKYRIKSMYVIIACLLCLVSIESRSQEIKSLEFNGRNGMIFRSTDNGSTWNSTVTQVKKMKIVFIGSGGGKYISTDGGSSWNKVTEPKSESTENKRLVTSEFEPHPLASSGRLRLQLSAPARVSIAFYTQSGEKVLETDGVNLPAGEQFIPLNVSTLSEGVYAYKTSVGTQVFSGTVIVIK